MRAKHYTGSGKCSQTVRRGVQRLPCEGGAHVRGGVRTVCEHFPDPVLSTRVWDSPPALSCELEGPILR